MFFNENFAEVKGLYFGSAGAHTYPKSGKFPPPPPPPLNEHNSATQDKLKRWENIKYSCNISSRHTNFLPGFPSGVEANLLFSDQISESANVSEKDKVPEGGGGGGGEAPLALLCVEESYHRFNLWIQSFCLAALTYQILQFCLSRKDCFDLTGSIYFLEF